MSTKCSNARLKCCSKCCKIFNVCLTILWTLRVKRLNLLDYYRLSVLAHLKQNLANDLHGQQMTFICSTNILYLGDDFHIEQEACIFSQLRFEFKKIRFILKDSYCKVQSPPANKFIAIPAIHFY